MKSIAAFACLVIISTVFLSSCGNSPRIQANTKDSQIDSIKAEIAFIKEHYKPGLGEIMNTIQLHHAKLWFAGINKDWDLASFEMDELNEMFDMAKAIETDRPEIKDIPMIIDPLDSLRADIKAKNVVAFKGEFKVVTQTCNDCHEKNHFGFNKIIIPKAPPVTNQKF